MKIIIEGEVQGVGFRPFLYRLGRDFGLIGEIKNTGRGVEFLLEDRDDIDHFIAAIHAQAPCGTVDSIKIDNADFSGDRLTISQSDPSKNRTQLPKDRNVCAECLSEYLDPGNRRYGYPFTHCAACGPRYSILKSMPYDRERTAMADFTMCTACQAEYENPDDRRFHAETNCCSTCGPRLTLVSKRGEQTGNSNSLRLAQQMIMDGAILAVKGIGGYQFVCLAKNRVAVERLRKIKGRPQKPFAVMFDKVPKELDAAAITATTSSAGPIVISNWMHTDLSHLAPELNSLGIMLPPTPLHYSLASLGPLVVTSANFKSEPMIINDAGFLLEYVDGILSHNRKVLHRIDDSVVRMIGNQPVTMRLGRGMAPLAIEGNIENTIESEWSSSGIIGLGGYLKNTHCVTVGKNLILSEHMGDLRSPDSLREKSTAIEKLKSSFQLHDLHALEDNHPDCATKALDLKFSGRETVPHHVAHILSGMAEHGISGNVLGIACDGMGFGEDSLPWGGEFFYINGSNYKRVASLLPFPLIGGDKAAREPRLCALGLLIGAFNHRAWEFIPGNLKKEFTSRELSIYEKTVDRFAKTTSVGRLLDGLAALSGVCYRSTYEGEAPAKLEAKVSSNLPTEIPKPVLIESNCLLLDWRPLVRHLISCLVEHRESNQRVPTVASIIHEYIAQMLFMGAQSLETNLAFNHVILSGGVFQNKVLVERLMQLFASTPMHLRCHGKIPPGDGGLALGQAYYKLIKQRQSQLCV